MKIKKNKKTVTLHGYVSGGNEALGYGYEYWRAEIDPAMREKIRDMAQSITLHEAFSMTSLAHPCEVSSDRKFEELQDPEGLELVVCDDCFFWRWEVGDHGYATTDLIMFETLEKEWAKL